MRTITGKCRQEIKRSFLKFVRKVELISDPRKIRAVRFFFKKTLKNIVFEVNGKYIYEMASER